MHLNPLKIHSWPLDNTGLNRVGALILRFLLTGSTTVARDPSEAQGVGHFGAVVREASQEAVPKPLSCSRISCLQCPPLMSF